MSEMQGMADGVCSIEEHKGDKKCQQDAMFNRIVQLNMIPDLVQMGCSMMGAWGDATVDGGLVQMRTLDFGGGPFANNNVLTVHHPSDSKNHFASLSFPGFAAAVTGFSDHIAQSEKVDMVYSPEKKPEGSYVG